MSRTCVGSSPHPRGTRPRELRLAFLFRFIPTPAGNPEYHIHHKSLSTVHPHTRGEPFFCGSGEAITAGSSPHPRGTRNSNRCIHLIYRFIPTPAGNPGRPVSAFMGNPVHPHTRGEPGTSTLTFSPVAGSSPHPRGTPDDTCLNVIHPRFIPTPAGNPD